MSRLRDELLDSAMELQRRTGWTIGTIGFKVANDGKFFIRLRNGASCSVQTYERIKERLAYLRAQPVFKKNRTP